MCRLKLEGEQKLYEKTGQKSDPHIDSIYGPSCKTSLMLKWSCIYPLRRNYVYTTVTLWLQVIPHLILVWGVQTSDKVADFWGRVSELTHCYQLVMENFISGYSVTRVWSEPKDFRFFSVLRDKLIDMWSGRCSVSHKTLHAVTWSNAPSTLSCNRH